MTTVSEVINHLKTKGYSADLYLKQNHLECEGNKIKLLPDEFIVDKHYRFEGESNPDDEAIVYAISSPTHNLKGVLVDAYGIYSGDISTEMLAALDERKNFSGPKDLGIGREGKVTTEKKFNKATELRPKGKRIIDAPLVELDIPDFMKQIKNEKTWHTSDRNAITIFKTDGMRIVVVALHAGAIMEEHSAEGIISVQVLEGTIKFSTSKDMRMLGKNQMVALHQGLKHSVEAVSEAVFLLTLTNSSKA